MNAETHCQQFQQDRKKTDESYCEWADWLKDCFGKRQKDREISVDEMILLEQFITGVPDGLAVRLIKRKS